MLREILFSFTRFRTAYHWNLSGKIFCFDFFLFTVEKNFLLKTAGKKQTLQKRTVNNTKTCFIVFFINTRSRFTWVWMLNVETGDEQKLTLSLFFFPTPSASCRNNRYSVARQRTLLWFDNKMIFIHENSWSAACFSGATTQCVWCWLTPHPSIHVKTIARYKKINS